MTNKELAAQCLIEAAELLNESSGKNGLQERIAIAKCNITAPDDNIKKARKDISKLFTHTHNKSDVDELNRSKKIINAIKSNNKSKSNSKNDIRLLTTTQDAAHEYAKEKMIELEKRNNKKGLGAVRLHQNINKRSKTPQNESIDILLSEAIDLLENK